MSRRKLKRIKKKRHYQEQDPQKAVKQKVKKNFPHMKVVPGPTDDGVSMSEVLGEFIEPYREFAQTLQAYRRLLTTAVVAWNLALFPEKDRPSRLEELLATFSREAREDGREIIEELMARKEKVFPQYRRMIIDFEVADNGDQWHVSVVSASDPA